MDYLAQSPYPPFEAPNMPYMSARYSSEGASFGHMERDSLAITHIGDRFNGLQPRLDTDAIDLEDPPTSRVPRKRQAVEALEAELFRGATQAGRHGDSIFSAMLVDEGSPNKVRRVGQGPSNLSAERLKALDQPGLTSSGLPEWLDGSTQYEVDTGVKKQKPKTKRSKAPAVYPSHPLELPKAPPIFMRSSGKFACINCKRRFRSKSELRHHARRYDKRPYQCDKCTKSFLYPKDLKRHETTHSGVKTFSCTVCPKSFSRKDNLRRHITNEHPGNSLETAEPMPFNFERPERETSTYSDVGTCQETPADSSSVGNLPAHLQFCGGSLPCALSNDAHPRAVQSLKRQPSKSKKRAPFSQAVVMGAKTPPVSPTPALDIERDDQCLSDISSNSEAYTSAKPSTAEQSNTPRDQAMARKLLDYLKCKQHESQPSPTRSNELIAGQALSALYYQAPSDQLDHNKNGPYYTDSRA